MWTREQTRFFNNNGKQTMTDQAVNYDDVKRYRLDPEREEELVKTGGECWVKVPLFCEAYARIPHNDARYVNLCQHIEFVYTQNAIPSYLFA